MADASRILTDPKFHTLPVEERLRTMIEPIRTSSHSFHGSQLLILEQSKQKFGLPVTSAAAQTAVQEQSSDIGLGWRTGLAGLEQTGANILNVLPLPPLGQRLERKQKRRCPNRELSGELGLEPNSTGGWQAPAAILKYAPAAKAGGSLLCLLEQLVPCQRCTRPQAMGEAAARISQRSGR